MLPDTFWLQVIESAVHTAGLITKEFWWVIAIAGGLRLLRVS